ncbi:hypothetical protein HMPREF1979_03262 [Actinomyces johnsonii F0542]|uniref:Uncharacterized protein n=1 Tax=Actinomyces johnsonii F0542 TaxID=1321818 RepID=U1RR50_9ACTO|nr:hypothetical protein HMPREF1979_03262 [Actinomyces johnsonii F0542]
MVARQQVVLPWDVVPGVDNQPPTAQVQRLWRSGVLRRFGEECAAT